MLVMLEMMVQTKGMTKLKLQAQDLLHSRKQHWTRKIPEEHVSESTQVVGDLNQELSSNAITLQPVLEHLRPGWNKISPHLFAITTQSQSMLTPLCVPVMSLCGFVQH